MFQFLRILSRRQKVCIFLTIDLSLLPVALLFTYAVQSLPGPAFDTLLATAPVLPYLLVIGAAVSLWLGLPWIQLNAYEYRAIALTGVYSSLMAVAAGGLAWVSGSSLPGGTYVIFGICYFLFQVASRALLYQIVVGLYRRAQPLRRVLVYGAGATGVQLVQALKSHEQIDPVAFVDDNPSLQGVILAGVPVYPPARIAELVESRKVRRVLLAMPSQSRPKQVKIIRRLQNMGLEVQALPSFAQLIGEEALVDKLTPVPSKNFLGRPVRNVELAEASDCYSGRTVLISGAGGTIGAELCRQVLACGPTRLVLFELSELALYNMMLELEALAEEQGTTLVPVLGSITDPRRVRQVLEDEKVQVVLHAAAYKHVPLVEANPLTGLANNVLGTRTLAVESANAGVERFILISSDKAVRPTNVMGASKRLAEFMLQDLASNRQGTIFAIVRFGNVLGSSGSVVPLFQEQISRGGPVTVTDPEVKRYFMTISEAVQLVLKAGYEAKGNEVFVLEMGALMSILQLARQVIASAGYTVRDEENPDGDIEIQFIGLRPGEKMEEELTLSDDLLPTPHQKIFYAREARLSEIEVASILRGLRQALAAGDVSAARAVIRRWVEGCEDWDAERKSS
ncbi:polysaccharide biosynthesis protein [Phaeobacter gallaeciensis]|uniref:Polysaccharide biosynthesis protein n=2 Tax=Roseobacteraceae TaxID=2854170 RepID=A0A366X2S2_9RHOB|nr:MULTISPECIES: nucleoside-diphosphate sugar epimerase/dehydratase [Roseobacteraceae]MBT3140024.1 polysaccharide biosynthesis protein [Falsiruegeria litorea]MBT8167171.1 polysaccharide biosynthesis protein [Falsiruegeria litorea]RBW57032.1 polysaccharide biosynthesis protein [Phaeobacter gallaeciensis]